MIWRRKTYNGENRKVRGDSEQEKVKNKQNIQNKQKKYER